MDSVVSKRGRPKKVTPKVVDLKYCLFCGELLCRKEKEPFPHFIARKYCDRKCAKAPLRKDERRKEMIKMRKTGISLKDIGNKYGVGKERVRRIVGNTGYISSCYINKDQIKCMKILRSKYMTLSEIARDLSISVATVKRHVGHIPRIPAGYKWCSKCKQIRTEEQHGKCVYCRKCNARRRSEYLRNNPKYREYARIQSRKHQKEHPEYYREYYRKHRTSIRPRDRLNLSTEEMAIRKQARDNIMLRIRAYKYKQRTP